MLQPNPTHWWQTLQAIPASKRAQPAWAATDERSTPYDRLKRVWADPTSTKDGPRVPGTERHLTSALVENFVIFPPADWVPALFERFQPALPVRDVQDAQWSYEYEQPFFRTNKGEKLADWVVHYRTAQGRGILVSEAKNIGKDLGPPTDRNGKPNKNLDPSYYLEMREFAWVPAGMRHLVYLVDQTVTTQVASQLSHHPRESYHILTWQSLVEVQIQLALKTLPAPIGQLVASFILAQAADFGIHLNLSGIEPASCQRTGATWRFSAGATSPPLEVICLPAEDFDPDQYAGTAVVWMNPGGPMVSLGQRYPNIPDHVLVFLAGCFQYRMIQDKYPPPCPALRYLALEPSFSEAEQSTADRQETIWRLPD